MPTNINIQNNVSSFTINTPPPTGGLDTDDYQVKAGVCPALANTSYLTFDRVWGIKNGKTYVFTSTFAVGSVSFSVVISLTGTRTSSNFWIQLHVSNGIASSSTAQISDTGTYYLSQGNAEGSVVLNLLSGSTFTLYSVNVVRFLSGTYDDVTITIGPGAQAWPAANTSLLLPPWNTQSSFVLIDVWGEGRFTTDEGLTVGFVQAYNINKVGNLVTNGPNKDQPIPNMIPVDDFTNVKFPIADGSVRYLTLMNAPIAEVAAEMYRVINKSNGVVMIWAEDGAERDSYQRIFQAAAPGMVLKPNDPIGSPFNQIVNGPRFGPPLIFGFSGVNDTNNF